MGGGGWRDGLTVLKELLDVRTHSGDRDLRHSDGLPVENLRFLMVRIVACVVVAEGREVDAG